MRSIVPGSGRRQEPFERLARPRLEDRRMDLPEIRQPHPLARRVRGEPAPQADQVLTPVEVAVDQVLRAVRRAARDHVEVGQIVRGGSPASPTTSPPGRAPIRPPASLRRSRSPIAGRPGDELSRRDEQIGEDRQDIAEAEVDVREEAHHEQHDQRDGQQHQLVEPGGPRRDATPGPPATGRPAARSPRGPCRPGQTDSNTTSSSSSARRRGRPGSPGPRRPSWCPQAPGGDFCGNPSASIFWSSKPSR